MISIIIPAYNEESVIEKCLESLLKQEYEGNAEIVVSANGCHDQTVELVKKFDSPFASRDWKLVLLVMEEGNKNKALNAADSIANFSNRMYLDADVVCEPTLVEEIVSLLDCVTPAYASGTLEFDHCNSYLSRAYGTIWRETPYIRGNIPGCGCYAVNAEGRKLWADFPSIHSDDKFVRLLFRKSQRKQACARYFWPLPEGILTLIRVRTRWIRGNRQLAKVYPDILINDTPKFKFDYAFVKKLLLNPVDTFVFFCIYTISALRAYWSPVGMFIPWSRAR